MKHENLVQYFKNQAKLNKTYKKTIDCNSFMFYNFKQKTSQVSLDVLWHNFPKKKVETWFNKL